MTNLSRRHMLQGLTALSGMAAVSSPALAKLAGTPQPDWALGWRNPTKHSLGTPQLKLVSGTMPKGLSGTFYRNGPAVFERSGFRMNHWFDGDGMVQRFHMSAGSVSHTGRMVETELYLNNEKEGRITGGGFGTVVPNPAPMKGPDSVNQGNTSVLPIGGELLALWEGGSAHRLDQVTLETKGPKSWGNDLQGMPFSAHPKVDVDGTIWNFGQDVFGKQLVLYRIKPSGELHSVKLIKDVPGGMIHDFCITDRHLIFVAPSFRAVRNSDTYLGRFKYQKDAAQHVVVLEKDDLTARRDFELPPGFQFHYGNAYTEANGDIHFSVCTGDDRFVTQGAKDVLRGKVPADSPVNLCHALLKADGSAKITETISEMADHEFPQFNPRFVGRKARYLYTVGRSHKNRPGQSAVLKHDLQTGDIQSHDYGAKTFAEEHLFVPGSGSAEDAGWLVGTTLDYGAKVTRLNVLDARNISDGPVAVFELPYTLPLGFHGTWMQG
ncbi:carotenoid oxygenase family protein [Hellea sp.]|nr:carotenoid oxygenase family protein [Hellea sp.]